MTERYTVELEERAGTNGLAVVTRRSDRKTIQFTYAELREYSTSLATIADDRIYTDAVRAKRVAKEMAFTCRESCWG